MPRRVFLAVVVLLLAFPTLAFAQVPDDIIEPPIPPCPWWDCGNRAEVVVEEYRVDTLIDAGVATTRVRQVLRNDSDFVAEGEFLFPIPPAAVVTGMTLWIDGEPVAGEILDGEAARRTYEDIVRRTADPALLEFADHGLLRLSVFPMPADATRTVEIEYREVLTADDGLTRYTHPLAAEHGATVEHVVARVEIHSRVPLKSVFSPTHAVTIDRPDERTAILGYEATDPGDEGLALYYSQDTGPLSLDVISYREGESGYFLLFASPGLADAGDVVAKDVVVVIDVSGSMEGEKIAQAQDAAQYVLRHLNVDDRFDVIAFSTATDSYATGLRSTAEAAAAADWVNRLGAGGSTNIDLALTEALSRSDGDRPLYVVFLTDGLPTEGVTDTAQILDDLARSAPNAASVFAFGVGHDVDTFLLDSIAREHHGTTTYVTPDESVDAAVEALYSKVASPVLTDVSIEVTGVTVSDVYPSPVPDVFSGGQLVLAGRYEGSGAATVTVSGMVGSEPTSTRFDEIRFHGEGGDDSVPRLWATRKIGDLLRRIRLDGPDDETIDQIVRLSIRWGIVTPYTSYLVTEAAPFGDQAIGDISRSAADAAATTIAPTTGAEAFAYADVAGELADAAFSSVPAGIFADLVRVAGTHTLRLTDGVWIDTTFDPAIMTPLAVSFASEAYFELAAADRSLAAALAVSPSVVVVHDGVAYRVVGADEAGEAIPDLTESTTDTTTATTVGAASAPADEPSGSNSAVALIAVAAAVGVAGALAKAAVRRG